MPKAAPTQTARDVLASLIGEEFSSADDVAILDGHELVGLVPIERLLAAPGDATMAGIMDADPPVVDPGCDQEAIAWKMVEHHESSVAVVDGAAASSDWCHLIACSRCSSMSTTRISPAWVGTCRHPRRARGGGSR